MAASVHDIGIDHGRTDILFIFKNWPVPQNNHIRRVPFLDSFLTVPVSFLYISDVVD
jgi:hypothetical protein